MDRSAMEQAVVKTEAKQLARDLLDEWDCSGGVKYWTDEEKRSFIKRAADLSAYVLDILGEPDGS